MIYLTRPILRFIVAEQAGYISYESMRIEVSRIIGRNVEAHEINNAIISMAESAKSTVADNRKRDQSDPKATPPRGSSMRPKRDQ